MLKVTITDAVELSYTMGEGALPVLNPAEVKKMQELYTTVYKGHEMLGWYSVGADVSELDMLIHR